MAREKDDYLDTMESLFGHPGWKIVEDEARKQIYQLQADALEAKMWDEVNIIRGKAAQLAELVRLPEIVSIQREQWTEDFQDANS